MAKAQVAREPQDKVMRLLSEFREHPSDEGIRRMLNASEDARHARMEYIGLNRAVRKILGRTLTEKESALVKRLA